MQNNFLFEQFFHIGISELPTMGLKKVHKTAYLVVMYLDSTTYLVHLSQHICVILTFLRGIQIHWLFGL